MGVQVCQWDCTKTVACSLPGTGGGLDLAQRWFGMSEADVEAKAGRFVRGKNAGKCRGWIVYRKVKVGGWCYPLQMPMKPGLIFARFEATYDAMGEAFGLDTTKFMWGATRVDTCYGHDPLKAKAAREAQAASMVAATERASTVAEQLSDADALLDRVVAHLEHPFFDGCADRFAYARSVMKMTAQQVEEFLSLDIDALVATQKATAQETK